MNTAICHPLSTANAIYRRILEGIEAAAESVHVASAAIDITAFPKITLQDNTASQLSRVSREASDEHGRVSVSSGSNTSPRITYRV